MSHSAARWRLMIAGWMPADAAWPLPACSVRRSKSWKLEIGDPVMSLRRRAPFSQQPSSLSVARLLLCAGDHG